MLISYSPQDSNVAFEPREITSLEDFINVAQNHWYSTGVFKNNYRNKTNFIQAQSIGLDIDGGMTLVEAQEKFKDYKHLIMPSKSHQREKNGIVCDRFRVILFLENTIDNQQDYYATWYALKAFCPAIDKACKDPSRFYYPSTSVVSRNDQGKTWPITKHVKKEVTELDLALDGGRDDRGELLLKTKALLVDGARPGERHEALVAATFDMKEQGYTVDQIKSRIDNMAKTGGNWDTPHINEKDIQTIEDVYNRETDLDHRDNPVHRKSMFEFKNIDQLVKEAGEIEWLTQGLLTKGGFSMIVGPPKAGKSTLVRQLVKAVAQGLPFLERDVRQGKVLYLTFEEQPAILKKQFQAVGISPNDPVLVHTGVVFGDTALEDLKDAIVEHQPELVILDTLFDISQLESINHYKEVKVALARIRKLARDTNTHLLGVHHTNKGGHGNGSVMGSNAIHGAVDTMIRFVPEDNGRRYLYSNGKYGNHWDDQEIIYDREKETYTLGKQREQDWDGL